MILPTIWCSEGKKIDALIFQNEFKLYRGQVKTDTPNVRSEECFGVLYYERTPQLKRAAAKSAVSPSKSVLFDVVGIIKEIVPPILSCDWAKMVIEMLEQGMFRPSEMSCLQIEDELRRRGYEGATICTFNVADLIGFHIMKNISSLPIVQIEEFASVDGRIESYLKNKGYRWLPDISNWQNAEGALWNRHAETWGMPAPMKTKIQRSLKY